MTKRHLLTPLAVLAALTLFVSSCSSDDASDTTTTEKASDTTEKESSDETTTTEDSGGGSVVPGVTPECAELQEAFTSLDVQGMMASFTDGSNPAPQFKAFADALAVAEEKAPDAIASDLSALADGYAELAASADKVDWDAIKAGDAQASAEAGELMQGFSSDDLANASEKVSDWINENCIPE